MIERAYRNRKVSSWLKRAHVKMANTKGPILVQKGSIRLESAQRDSLDLSVRGSKRTD